MMKKVRYSDMGTTILNGILCFMSSLDSKFCAATNSFVIKFAHDH